MIVYFVRHGESANNVIQGANIDENAYFKARNPDPTLT